MGFNIIAPYMECVTHKYISPSVRLFSAGFDNQNMKNVSFSRTFAEIIEVADQIGERSCRHVLIGQHYDESQTTMKEKQTGTECDYYFIQSNDQEKIMVDNVVMKRTEIEVTNTSLSISNSVFHDSSFAITVKGAQNVSLFLNNVSFVSNRDDNSFDSVLSASGVDAIMINDCTFRCSKNSLHTLIDIIAIRNATLQNVIMEGVEGSGFVNVVSSQFLRLVNVRASHIEWNGYMAAKSEQSIILLHAVILASIESCTFHNVMCSAVFAESTSLNIVNTEFRNCSSLIGGAVLAKAVGSTMHSLTVKESQFSNCQTNETGGAVYTQGISVVIDGSTFKNCMSSSGGSGMFVDNGQSVSTVIKNSHFLNSKAHFEGGALNFQGINSIIMNQTSFSNCTVSTEEGFGGAVSIFVQEDSPNDRVSINACIFDGGEAQTGGGIYIETKENAEGTQIEIKNSDFQNLVAVYNGSGLAIVYSDTSRYITSVIKSTRFINCSADTPEYLDGRGGSFYISNGHGSHSILTQFEHCSFIGSSAWKGGAGFVEVETASNIKTYFEDCLFEDTYARFRGGSLFLTQVRDGSENATWSFNNCVFNRPAAGMMDSSGYTHGGAIFLHAYNGLMTIEGCIFQDAFAKFGSDLFSDSYARDSNQVSIYMTNSSIYNSTCHGAFIYASAIMEIDLKQVNIFDSTAVFYVGPYFTGVRDLRLENCLFQRNDIKNGMVSGNNMQRFKMSSCIFKENVAMSGAGIEIDTIGNAIVRNSIFLNQYAKQSGAGILVRRLDMVEIRNCSFSGSVAGRGSGVIVEKASYVDISNITVSECLASLDGGIILYDIKTVEINNGQFTGNKAGTFGSALSLNSVRNISISSSSFDGNSAGMQGGCIMSVFPSEGAGHFSIDDCSFLNNSADGAGGVMRTESSPAASPSLTEMPNIITITNSKFFSNSAENGGSIDLAKSESETFCHIDSCQFYNNVASVSGGVLSVMIDKVTVSNSSFRSNRGGVFGGAFYIHPKTKKLWLVVNSSTLEENEAQEGGVLFAETEKKSSAIDISSRDCILSHNRAVDNGRVFYVTGGNLMHVENTAIKDITGKHASLGAFKNNLMFGTLTAVILSNVSLNMPPMSEFGIELVDITAVDDILLKSVSFTCPIDKRAYAKPKTELQYVCLNASNQCYYSAGPSLQYECMICEDGTYSTGRGYYHIGLPASENYKLETIISDNDECFQCPPYGRCLDGKIVSTPGDWGYHHEGKVHMVHCPSGFCCQQEPCESINECNEGRTGSICSSCLSNYSLSISDGKCIENDCNSNVVQSIMIAALCYVTLLLLSGFQFPIISFAGKLRYCKKSHKAEEVMSDISQDEKQSSNSTIPRNKMQKCVNDNGNVDVKNMQKQKEDNLTLDVVSKMKQMSNRTDDEKEPGIQSVSIRGKLAGLGEDARDRYYMSLSFSLLQVVIYHIQDVALFRIDVPRIKPKDPLVNIDRVVDFFRLRIGGIGENSCIEGIGEVERIFINLSIIPILITFLVGLVLMTKIFSVVSKKDCRYVYEKILLSFLMMFMYTNQAVTMALFQLVSCVSLGNTSKLLVDGNIECYQSWQAVILCYIVAVTIPLPFIFLFASSLLHETAISSVQFIVSLIFPLPCVMLYAMRIIIYKLKAYDMELKTDDSYRRVILNKVYSIFDPRRMPSWLCWGGVIEMRRLLLVAASVFIQSHVNKTLTMMGICFISAFANYIVSPFKSNSINNASQLSLQFLNVVGLVNLMFGFLDYIDAAIPHEKDVILKAGVYLETFAATALPLCIGIVVICLYVWNHLMCRISN